MEIFFICLILVVFLSMLPLLHVLFHKQNPSSMPPGKMGWPIIGETLEFLSAGRTGRPEKFVIDRMIKYSPECFKTSILGQPMAFLCGPSGNKFLFYNVNKSVKVWWPNSLQKIFPNSLQNDSNETAKKVKRLLPQFLKPKALQRYIGIIDAISQRHFASKWEGKEEIIVFPLAKEYTFWLACRLLLSIEDPDHVTRLVDPFHLLASGIISIPTDFPGTPFNKAIRAAKFLRNEFTTIITKKKHELAMQMATPTQDLLSHMLSLVDENGEHVLSEELIAEAIMGLLLAGYDGVTSTITLIIKYLAELPHIYDAVYREQLEIAKSKAPGELLNCKDIQEMKYSWNVACEVMRLLPPSPGVFREATNDFLYAGFTIPKGWKLHWSAHSTHWNPQYFSDPEKFNPTRFEGTGPAPYTYVPFGGGPGLCPGREYARLVILVFMHNVVKRFRWEKLLPDEQMIVHLSPTPAKGLPIRLISHEVTEKED